MITEIEEESQTNQSEVTVAMASLRQVIDEHEQVLIKNIRDVEKDQKRSIEGYKRQLQGEQQSLIEQVLNSVNIRKEKQPMKRWEAKTPFEDYIRRTDLKLLELKPLTRTGHYIPGLKKLREMETEIRNIKVETVPKYQNPQLQQRIASNANKTTLDLTSLNLTDKDMEIVAAELEINKVRNHLLLLSLKLLQCHKNKVFQTSKAIVQQMFFCFFLRQQLFIQLEEVLNKKSELNRTDLLKMLRNTGPLK